jgi:hypothetical protein
MTTLMILFPAIMAIKYYKSKGKNLLVVGIAIWASVWVLIGYSSAILTILKMTGALVIH